jgi:hypothetical protein
MKEDTNSTVENWMKNVKVDILEKEKRFRMGLFIRKMNIVLKGRFREYVSNWQKGTKISLHRTRYRNLKMFLKVQQQHRHDNNNISTLFLKNRAKNHLTGKPVKYAQVFEVPINLVRFHLNCIVGIRRVVLTNLKKIIKDITDKNH